MYLLASICAFFCYLKVPAQEEYIETLIHILQEQQPSSFGYFTENDLEIAKSLIRNDLSIYNRSTEYAVLQQYSEDLLHSISLSHVNHSQHSDPRLFFSLPLSSEEEKTIHKIITTLAETHVFGLLFEKGDLEKKGKFIEDVHPMRFLGVVFSNSQLRLAMHEIKKSTFKWNGFMEGFERRIREEQEKDNLLRYVPGFAKHVHADPEKISYFILHHNWEGLIRYLM